MFAWFIHERVSCSNSHFPVSRHYLAGRTPGMATRCFRGGRGTFCSEIWRSAQQWWLVMIRYDTMTYVNVRWKARRQKLTRAHREMRYPNATSRIILYGYLFTTELRHTCTPKYFWSKAYISNGRRFTKSAFRILLLSTLRVSRIN